MIPQSLIGIREAEPMQKEVIGYCILCRKPIVERIRNGDRKSQSAYLCASCKSKQIKC